MNIPYGSDYPGSTTGGDSKEKVRVAIYARVSSELQVENWSLDSQVNEATEFVGRLPKHSVAATYVEEGHSAWKGKADSRPEYQRLMAEAKSGKFDLVVTTSVDRMSRSVVNLLEMVQELRDYGIDYRSIHEDVKFIGPMGEMMLTQYAAFAELQSSMLSAHSKRGREERLRQGLYSWRPPYGYELCDHTCPATESHMGCHVNEDKAKVVRKVFRLYASGTYSQMEISDLLNADGYRTNGFSADRVGIDLLGNRWTSDAIARMLKTRFYISDLEFNGKSLPGIHEPILTKEDFERVQAVGDRNARRYKFDGRRIKHDHLLSRLVRCDDCKRRMHAHVRGPKDNIRTSYRVPKASKGEPCEHTGRSVAGFLVDEEVEQFFEGFELRPDWRDYIYTKFATSINHEEFEQKAQTLRARRDRLDLGYAQGKIDDEEYVELKETVDAALDSTVLPDEGAIAYTTELLANFGDLWARANTKERNGLLRVVLEAVHIDVRERRVVEIAPNQTFIRAIQGMKNRLRLSVMETPDRPEKVELKELVRVREGVDFTGAGGAPTSTRFVALEQEPSPMMPDYGERSLERKKADGIAA